MSATQLLRPPYRACRELARRAAVPLNHVRRRRLDLCCCGLSKTGTHSMAGIFSQYRSAHHPDADVRLSLASALMRGNLDPRHAERLLRRRDRVLRLEVESSTLAGILIEPLAEACPSKRFVLTIRDVYSWCDSWIDHNVNSPPALDSPWAALDRLRLRADEVEPTRFDAPLVALGFPPLACFFQLWARHNREVLDAVSPDRLLVVRTDELSARLPDVATWAGVPPETLRADRAWLFRTVERHRVLATLDASYVRETADRYCGALMAEYFPDVVRADDHGGPVRRSGAGVEPTQRRVAPPDRF